MNDAPETSKRSLTRQELLAAIDFEIDHRESMLSRHGVTTWGIACANIALIWTAALEALSSSHDLTRVFLVLIAGTWLFLVLSRPWMRVVGLVVPAERTDRRYDIKEHLLRSGFYADSFPLLMIPAGAMVFISIYLICNGFLLVGISTGSLYFLVLLGIAFCWVLCRVRIPIRRKLSQHDDRLSIRTRLLIVAIALTPLPALGSIWPVGTSDIRLGMLLAGLVSLSWLSAMLVRPPTANRLRSLRSRLAFGEVEIETAIREAESILHGSPAEHYLTDKAEEVIAEAASYKFFCDSVVEATQRVSALAEKLQSPGCSPAALRDIAADFRALTKQMMADMGSMKIRSKAAMSLRTQFLTRVEAAKIFLNLDPNAIRRIVERVASAGNEAEAARQRFRTETERLKPSLDFVC